MISSMENKNNRGIVLYLSSLIVAIILAIGLGLGAILSGQVKTLKEIGDSVGAFYAADTGAEYLIYKDNQCRQAGCGLECAAGCKGLPVGYDSGQIPLAGAFFRAKVPGCYTINSRGDYRGVVRRVEAGSFSYKTVFVLQGANGMLGGVAGADSFCQTAAAGANIPLPGNFKAWITGMDPLTAPASRFVRANVPYIRTDCEVVSDNWADLTDGTLQEPINKNENGAPTLGLLNVLTNTRPDGTQTDAGAGNTCSDWTSPFDSVNYGKTDKTDSEWTNVIGANISCELPANFYCFQQ